MRNLVTRFPGRPFVAALPLIFFLNGCWSASSYLAKGNGLFAKGEFAEASLNYRKALQKDPNSGEAYYRLGVADLKLNKAAEALQDLEHAVRWMPDNPDAKTEKSIGDTPPSGVPELRFYGLMLASVLGLAGIYFRNRKAAQSNA